jgi:hypothetical protein
MRRIAAIALAATTLGVFAPPARSDSPTIYMVGAAWRDISPPAGVTINLGGFGFGDGSVLPDELIGRGGTGQLEQDHIAARAIVIQDSVSGTAVAMASVETQGMFAAYQQGPFGLYDIESRVAADVPELPVSNILISNDHTHSGPDAIGAWGFIPTDYLALIAAQTVGAIEDAWASRQPATIVQGADDAADLIYNQVCTEALNQSPSSNFPNTICTATQEGKDSLVRVLQARAVPTKERPGKPGAVVATLASFAAHATLGGGTGVHGDWPQFLSEALAAQYGGVGIAMEGTNGRTQPCRPACSFTDPETPGYGLAGRKARYTGMLMYHVGKALAGAPAVSGPVKAAKAFIRHDAENPALFAALMSGETIGAPIARSRSAPWTVGNTVRTVVTAFRVGGLLFNGAPGEPYPNIAAGVVEATNVPRTRHWTFGLSDDQLGYLIAPAEAYPLIAAQTAVNDNALFNISPTIGDHVMCAQIRLASQIGFAAVRPDPRCTLWDAFDAAGDPLGS